MIVVPKKYIDLSIFDYRNVSFMSEYVNNTNILKKHLNIKSKERKEVLRLYNETFNPSGDLIYNDKYDNLSLVINNSSFITSQTIRDLCGKSTIRKNINGRYVTYGCVESNGIKVLLEHSYRGSDIHMPIIPDINTFDKIILEIVENILKKTNFIIKGVV